MKKIVLASGNKGKLVEFSQLCEHLPVEIVAQSEFQVSEVAETGTTFVENAIIKARHAARVSGLAAIADDSGLQIDYLNGAPGVYSARFSADEYGAGATDEKNNQKVLALLKDVAWEQRSARYQCVLVYMSHAEDSTPIICQSDWKGVIGDKEQGENGFGYDPLFCLPEFSCTSAQLSAEKKNQISHRGKAMVLLYQQLNKLMLA